MNTEIMAYFSNTTKFTTSSYTVDIFDIYFTS